MVEVFVSVYESAGRCEGRMDAAPGPNKRTHTQTTGNIDLQPSRE